MKHPRVVLAVAALAAVTLAVPEANSASRSGDLFSSNQREYWAFQKVDRSAVPEAAHSEWGRQPIDAFVLHKLERKGIEPGAPADKIALLRRATFDLTGLPPTPAEVQAFLDDDSPDAFDKVIERLLTSPRYGERWARHWLDLARYAESEGFKSDETRPNAWRYRDYVIDAFNSDKPYDRFVREQIAGDELWPKDPWARVATAFNRHYPDESNARNLMQRRQEILDDITDVVGLTFMGLTFGCAKCHDHKFDPILQKDYYRLQAFFANVGQDDEIEMWPQDRVAEYRRRLVAWEDETKSIREEIHELLEPKRQEIIKGTFEKYPELIQSSVEKAADERTPYETHMAYKAKPYLNPSPESIADGLKGEEKGRYECLQAELEKFSDLHPGEFPIGIGVTDLGRDAPATHVLTVGMYDAPQDQVEPGFLSILDPNPAVVATPSTLESSGRRTALANWLSDPANPLTARVMVNRIWHYHFGRGIVATPSDFGLMGERPSHPELLDYLADEFVRSGWSVKHVHRLIMRSATYQQSSAHREAANKKDPFNKLLWRFPPQRLEAEVIRDAALHVAGLLNPKVGGPSVFPPLPEGMPTPWGGWDVSEDPEDQQRRSIYIFVRRNARYPMLEAFDMPDTHESCAQRNMTTTAPQALTLLNSEQTVEWARGFAGRVLEASGSDQSAGVDLAYQLAYSRRADAWEKDTALTFLNRQRDLIAARAAEGGGLAVPATTPESMNPADAAAFVDFCHTLLNSNEFVYRF